MPVVSLTYLTSPRIGRGDRGYRPTHGRYSGNDLVPISHSRGSPGLIARTVADIRFVDAGPLHPAGLAGHPGVSLPAGVMSTGLPFGIELDVRVHAELDPLALAEAVAGTVCPLGPPEPGRCGTGWDACISPCLPSAMAIGLSVGRRHTFADVKTFAPSQ